MERKLRHIKWFLWAYAWRPVLFWAQRRIRGWDDSDTYSLDYTMAKLMLPRFRRYRELNDFGISTVFYPRITGSRYTTTQEKAALKKQKKAYDDVEYFLTTIVDNRWEYNKKKFNSGKDFLINHFDTLWW